MLTMVMNNINKRRIIDMIFINLQQQKILTTKIGHYMILIRYVGRKRRYTISP